MCALMLLASLKLQRSWSCALHAPADTVACMFDSTVVSSLLKNEGLTCVRAKEQHLSGGSDCIWQSCVQQFVAARLMEQNCPGLVGDKVER